MNYDSEFLLSLYRKMVLIRQFEERVKYLFLEGVMPGTIHQYQGQEAIAVGVCSALGPEDVITSTHRPHGHAIAKGVGIESLMHELFGKATGCCGGKGGSMHVGDLDKGMIPAIAIVGGNVPIGTGVALAFRMNREARVAVCFMGDGAVNEGAFHEGVNMGAIWSLPVLYVIENSSLSPILRTGYLTRQDLRRTPLAFRLVCRYQLFRSRFIQAICWPALPLESATCDPIMVVHSGSECNGRSPLAPSCVVRPARCPGIEG